MTKKDQLLQDQTPNKTQGVKLKDLIALRLEEVRLIHAEVDNQPIKIIELSNDTLTAEGRSDWADVLDAQVNRIYSGSDGTRLEMSGLDASRLDSFSDMLAGLCASEDYERWMVQDGNLSIKRRHITEPITVAEFVAMHYNSYIQIMSPGGFVDIYPGMDVNQLSAHAGEEGISVRISWDEIKDQLIMPESCGYGAKDNQWNVLSYVATEEDISENPNEGMSISM